MELEIENTEVVSANNIQIEAPGSIEVIEGEKDYEVSVVKKEYTIIGDSIFIPSMYEDAPPWLKEFIDTTLNVAVTNRDQSLIDRLQSMLSLLDYVPKNQYTEQINQIVSEDGIINSRIATLNSNFTDTINTTNATIAEINLTYASKNEAAAIASNMLSASLSGSGQIGSTLIQLQEAYADLESTTAQSVNALESVMEGEINGNARAMETIRTYVGIDEAGASTGTGLSAYLESSDGTIGGADSQLANTIRVTAEGVESKFAYNSIVNINGVYKKSGFGLTTNYTSGAGSQANPYVSEFWIDASRLKFTNSNQTGQTAPFTIDATGATPQITFNGKVTFSNVTGTSGLALKDMSNVSTIDGGKIVTNTLSADKLTSSTGASTTWTGGGLVSQNFNGNVSGNIGNPSQGFRLSSNAAGTVADPNIYGAFIRASYLMKGSYIVDPYTGAYGYALCSVTVGTLNGSGVNPSGYSSQFAYQGNIVDLSSVIISNNCKISITGSITGYGSGGSTVVSLYLDVIDAGGNVYARHLVMSRPFAFGGRALWSFGYGNNLSIDIPTHYSLRLAIITTGYTGDLHDAYFNASWSNM